MKQKFFSVSAKVVRISVFATARCNTHAGSLLLCKGCNTAPADWQTYRKKNRLKGSSMPGCHTPVHCVCPWKIASLMILLLSRHATPFLCGTACGRLVINCLLCVFLPPAVFLVFSCLDATDSRLSVSGLAVTAGMHVTFNSRKRLAASSTLVCSAGLMISSQLQPLQVAAPALGTQTAKIGLGLTKPH
jgi:hypothetical protein